MSWYEVLEYANLLSAQCGLPECFDCTGTQPDFTCSLKAVYTRPQDCPGYRLPTEAEWEYSMRAGSQVAFYPTPGFTGEIIELGEDPNADHIAWYYFNSDTGQGRMTHPVMGKKQNSWRLYDMAGNVYEWVWDFSGVHSSAAVDPFGPESGTNRNRRGGFWNNWAFNCRAASCEGWNASFRSFSTGLRLARTIF